MEHYGRYSNSSDLRKRADGAHSKPDFVGLAALYRSQIRAIHEVIYSRGAEIFLGRSPGLA